MLAPFASSSMDSKFRVSTDSESPNPNTMHDFPSTFHIKPSGNSPKGSRSLAPWNQQLGDLPLSHPSLPVITAIVVIDWSRLFENGASLIPIASTNAPASPFDCQFLQFAKPWNQFLARYPVLLISQKSLVRRHFSLAVDDCRYEWLRDTYAFPEIVLGDVFFRQNLF
jgi:hypothetical protein